MENEPCNKQEVAAYKAALKLLVIKDYSRQKLLSKLKTRGFTSTESTKALAQLEAENLYDEFRYTEARVRGLLRKLYGPKKIQMKLQTEGVFISLSEIHAIAHENFLDLDGIRQDALRKKFGDEEIDQNSPEIRKYLHERGFEL